MVLDNDQYQSCLTPIIFHCRSVSLSINFVSRISFNHSIVMIKTKKVAAPAIFTYCSVIHVVNAPQASTKAKSSLFYFQVGPYASIPSPYHSARSIYQSGAGPRASAPDFSANSMPARFSTIFRNIRWSTTSLSYPPITRCHSQIVLPVLLAVYPSFSQSLGDCRNLRSSLALAT